MSILKPPPFSPIYLNGFIYGYLIAAFLIAGCETKENSVVTTTNKTTEEETIQTQVEENIESLKLEDVSKDRDKKNDSAYSKPIRDILVSNVVELNAAISQAKPNDRIVMRNGTWKDLRIDFNSKGEPSKPVILIAQSPGKVVLTGKSRILLTKPYLVLEDLLFEDGTIEKGAVISIDSDHCSVRSTAIINCNPSSFNMKCSWIRIKGSWNTVEDCLFKEKTTLGPLIINYGYNARYNTIRGCHFQDIPLVSKKNGREIIRVIGPGHDDKLNDDGAFCTIENNLFQNADGEGIEIISLKSSRNLVRNNTVLASCGGFVSRRGGYNIFNSNIILGNFKSGTFGFRLSNQFHEVRHNYVGSVVHSGIAALCGEFVDSALTNGFRNPSDIIKKPLYSSTKNCLITNNTIINATHGVEVGRGYLKDWNRMQLVLLPESNEIKNNHILNSKDAAIHVISQEAKKPFSLFEFLPNYIDDNRISDKNSTGSPVQDFNLWKQSNISTGADRRLLKLLSPDDVGPLWMR